MPQNNYHFLTSPYKIDRKVYKYYSNIDNAVSCIQKRSIHLDDPRKFNDPFEAYYCCQFYSIHSRVDKRSNIIAKIHTYVAKAAQLQPQFYKRIMDAMLCSVLFRLSIDETETNSKDVIQEIYRSFENVDFSFEEFCDAVDFGFRETNPFIPIDCKMSCFSEIYDSMLMWSYYADSHKGLCIEYDLSKLSKSQENQEIIDSFAKVHYSPNRIDCLSGDAEDNAVKILTSKSDVWSHEQEWRIVCETENEWLPFDCITGIYFGQKFKIRSKQFLDIVEAIGNNEGVALYKAKLHNTRYQLEFSKIHSQTLDILSKQLS